MSSPEKIFLITSEKSKEIKKRLIDLNLSQRELAKEAGVTPYWLWLIINGKRKSKRIYNYLEKKLGIKI